MAASQLPTIGQTTALAETRETAATAVATTARALVEARYLMALHRPRDWSQVRARILDACKRPRFAELAMYSKPQGKDENNRQKFVTGLSVRFVEEALRAMGNAFAETTVVYDDDEKRIVKVTVTDLEGNLTYPTDLTITKTVERSTVKPGTRVFGERINSRGAKTYIVAAFDDEILNKQNNMVSKAIRTSGLRLLPIDIAEEAEELIAATMKQAAKEKGAAEQAAKAFEKIGIPRDRLEWFLGIPIDRATGDDVTELRRIYQAIKDGEAAWDDVEKTGPLRRAEGGPKPTPKTTTVGAKQPGETPIRELSTEDAYEVAPEKAQPEEYQNDMDLVEERERPAPGSLRHDMPKGGAVQDALDLPGEKKASRDALRNG